MPAAILLVFLVLAPRSARAGGEAGRPVCSARRVERALARRPRSYWLWMELARCEISRGRYEAARSAFSRAKRLDPSRAAAYVQEGYASLGAGRDETARSDFESLVSIDFASPAGYHHLARYYELHGDAARAESGYREALRRLEARPDSPALRHTLFHLGQLILARGRPREARELLSRGLSASGDDRASRRLFLEALAQCESRLGRGDRALALYERAVAVCTPATLCPPGGRTEAITDVGLFQLESRRLAQAGRAADAAVAAWGRERAGMQQAEPDSRWSKLNALARLCAGTGRLAQARSLYGQVLGEASAAPFSPEVAAAREGLKKLP